MKSTSLRSLYYAIPLAGLGLAWIVSTVLMLGVVACLVWLVIRLAVAMTRPWIRTAASPANLRTG